LQILYENEWPQNNRNTTGKGIGNQKEDECMIEAQFEFIRLARLLNEEGVKFMVIGGFAVNHYGYSRNTADIDVYIKESEENRKALVEALDLMGYGRMDALLRVPIIAGYCEIMMDDGFYVDLMTSIPGLDPNDYDVQFERRKINLIEGVQIPYINFNDLVVNKKATGRPKDLEDCAQLERIGGNTNRLNQEPQ
jgi:predicted nucleotidyltransferase